MISTLALLVTIFGSIKNFIRGTLEDNYDKEYRKVNDIAYIGNNGLTDSRTGHPLRVIDKYTYFDEKSRKYIKKQCIDPEDVEKEEIEKQRAIKRGRNIYRCSDYYLPAGVRGFAYKSIDKERLYVLRDFASTNLRASEEGYIHDRYYVSLSSDNYGHVELTSLGKELTEKENNLKKYEFDLTTPYGKNKDYIWRVG